MPEQVKRLIYIDCDTLVLDDLSSLMSINMEESPIGCVLILLDLFIQNS